MPLLIPETALGIRAALRRSPPRMTILAQYSPVNMPTTMKKPTTANKANTTRAAVSQTRRSVTTSAPYVAVTGLTGSL
jgi:hypothetical protein